MPSFYPTFSQGLRPHFIAILLTLLLSIGSATWAQPTFRWYDPTKSDVPVIEGQAWPNERKAPYDRLPARTEALVRPAVWSLSTQSAGLIVRFRANAPHLKVRYGVRGRQSLPHMPATGVSGIDLYAISSEGEWRWCAGKYAFGDTIQYDFNPLEPNDRYHKEGREYRLYLPPYTTLDWLEVGAPTENNFQWLPVRPDKPIVVYGTSIAQGACASRPGMMWTSILGRKMDRPLINLGFSGNGRLEPELIELLTELDPKVYILDCLPNLIARSGIPLNEVKQRILNSVRRLRQAKPTIPIILTEHAGYTDEAINPTNRLHFTEVNEALRTLFAQLKSEGIRDLYLLPKEALGQDLDTMVDGTHPNDLGMLRYAEGYEKILRVVLHEPAGPYSTTQPCTQLRELPGYDWELRHRQVLAHNQSTQPATVLIGNSITHFWGGIPKAHIARGADSFATTFGTQGVSNMGFGWDRIENVLWRVYHGELDGFEAKRIFVMIGTNNLHLNSNEEILAGWKLLIEAIQQRQPKAQLHMVGIYPRRNQEKRIRHLNEQLARLTGTLNVSYLDPGAVLLQTDGTVQESLFTDGLHPNTVGYEVLGKAFSPYLK